MDTSFSLKSRFLLLMAGLLLLATFASWLVFEAIAKRIIEEWGLRTAEIQVRYDSARLMQPLERELALARQMANSNVLRRWIAEPGDAQLEAEAFEEMESFRRNFRENNYFLALRHSGAYYHNNADNAFVEQPYRYTLNPARPADAWFFKLIEEGRDFHININPDEELGVTKLWIDVLMRDGEEILGIIGTGLALDELLREVVDIRQPGITTLFLDQSGAIQLHRDAQVIDYASVVKPEGQKNTFDQLLDSPDDVARIRATMSSLREAGAENGQVKSDFVQVNGKRHLVGLAYLPGIDWYEMTLLDLSVLMPVSSFATIAQIFALTLLLALLLLHVLMRRWILNPLASLDAAMRRVGSGDLTLDTLPVGKGEIGQLIQHFASMSAAIRDNTRDLEAKVRERTESLHRQARIDPLTELANRRGMNELLDKEMERATRQGTPLCLIWLDVDNFKELNDSLGHAAGDNALSEVAQKLRETIRPYDHAARWGGDEFLILLPNCDQQVMSGIAERIRTSIEQDLCHLGQTVTVSVGACQAMPGEDLDQVLQRADEALYMAKQAGRNRLMVHALTG